MASEAKTSRVRPARAMRMWRYSAVSGRARGSRADGGCASTANVVAKREALAEFEQAEPVHLLGICVVTTDELVGLG